MSSFVVDLQNEILNPNCDIINVLRKAHLIAAKLKLTEFDLWIQGELNGYYHRETEAIPEYRKIKGTLKAFNPYQGWIPAQCTDDEIEKAICERKLWQSVAELQELYNQSNSGVALLQFPAGQAEFISKMFDTPCPMQFALHISTHYIKSIIEQVKNCLLEWTIRLENEGIVGEEMRFTDTEREKAHGIPQTINNYYGNTNVINSPIEHSEIVAGDNASFSFQYEAAQKALEEIESSLDAEELSTEDRETAMELLTEIKEKISQQRKPSVIKAAMSGLSEFLIGVSASATIALVQGYLQGLF